VPLDKTKSKISDIKILNFYVNLTPKERMKIRKMGHKSVFYVDQGLRLPEVIQG
jgi:hypothetical protein